MAHSPPSKVVMRSLMRRALVVGALVCVVTSTGAQPLRLIDACPSEMKPVASPSPAFPASAAFDYHVTVSFVIDVGGAVLVPRVKLSRISIDGTRKSPAPPEFDSALVAALAKWKYASRVRPCAATFELSFSD
jgi:hypothetical protein